MEYVIGQWERVEPEPAFAGAYGGTPLFENAKVIEVRRLKNNPTVADTDVSVDTFVGAQNRLGTVTITFRVAGNHFEVGEAKVVKQR